MNNNYPTVETIGTSPYSTLYRLLGKRVLDIVLVVLILPIVLPVICVLALLSVCAGGKPFYSQERIGRNGRIFRMWSLSSVIDDANRSSDYLRGHDQDCHRVPSGASGAGGLDQFLRNASLAELPQLFNVLAGDMSVVGPRPMSASENAQYPGEDYYDLQPGITGNWLVSARSNLSLAECAMHDSRYNRGLSFANDLAILGATLKPAFLNMRDAGKSLR